MNADQSIEWLAKSAGEMLEAVPLRAGERSKGDYKVIINLQNNLIEVMFTYLPSKEVEASLKAWCEKRPNFIKSKAIDGRTMARFKK